MVYVAISTRLVGYIYAQLMMFKIILSVVSWSCTFYVVLCFT